MKNFSNKIALGLVIALAAFSVSAQEFKVGVVNLDRIFREANSAKAGGGSEAIRTTQLVAIFKHISGINKTV